MMYADNWEVFVVNDSKTPYAKVFCFIRGYWRVNSGIAKIEKKDDYYIIHGVSGSQYFCKADMYGIPERLKEGVYNQILASGKAKFLNDQEWENFDILISSDSLL